MKPIQDLDELERKILRHHIVNHTYGGLSLVHLFFDIHPDNKETAISNLVKEGYYSRPNRYDVHFTPIGHYESYKYFKFQIKMKQFHNSIKSRFNSLMTHAIAVLVGVLITVIATVVLIRISKKEQSKPQQPHQQQEVIEKSADRSPSMPPSKTK